MLVLVLMLILMLLMLTLVKLMGGDGGRIECCESVIKMIITGGCCE